MKRENKFKFYSPYTSILFLETRTHVTFQHRLATLYILIDSESSKTKSLTQNNEAIIQYYIVTNKQRLFTALQGFTGRLLTDVLWF
jgi:hypothetical protein